jgi:hypothetical protein
MGGGRDVSGEEHAVGPTKWEKVSDLIKVSRTTLYSLVGKGAIGKGGTGSQRGRRCPVEFWDDEMLIDSDGRCVS